MLEQNIKSWYKNNKGSYTADELMILLDYKGNICTFFKNLKSLVKNKTLIKEGNKYAMQESY